MTTFNGKKLSLPEPVDCALNAMKVSKFNI